MIDSGGRETRVASRPLKLICAEHFLILFKLKWLIKIYDVPLPMFCYMSRSLHITSDPKDGLSI